MTALLIGSGLGAVLIGTLYRLGALEDRSGLAVLLGAIALFWPVFAFQAEASAVTIIFHCAVFLAFGALAAYGFKTSATILAAGIIAHGLFDAATLLTGHPGPVWWPAMCGGLDVVAGALLLFLIKTQRIPA